MDRAFTHTTLLSSSLTVPLTVPHTRLKYAGFHSRYREYANVVVTSNRSCRSHLLFLHSRRWCIYLPQVLLLMYD
jgi:hypothetical protein